MEENHIKYIDFLSENEIKKILETDKKSFIGLIPKDINSKDELMHIYFVKLNLAPYFGGNWDALDEILIDFDWINAEKIIIVHQDIPKLSTKDIILLIKVLGGAAKKMNHGHETSILPTGKHKLEVVFPAAYREEIYDIISQAD